MIKISGVKATPGSKPGIGEAARGWVMPMESGDFFSKDSRLHLNSAHK